MKNRIKFNPCFNYFFKKIHNSLSFVLLPYPRENDLLIFSRDEQNGESATTENELFTCATRPDLTRLKYIIPSVIVISHKVTEKKQRTRCVVFLFCNCKIPTTRMHILFKMLCPCAPSVASYICQVSITVLAT